MNETKKTGIVVGLVFLFLMIIPIAMIFKSGEGKELLAEVEALINSNETQIIYIGSKDCSYCDLFNPVIKGASENNNFEYTYFDIAALTQTQRYKLSVLLEKEEGVGTPHTVIVQDGEIIDELIGYVAEEKLLEFLEKNDVIGEAVVTPKILNLIDYNDFKEIVNGTEKKIVVFASATCSWCVKAKPELEAVSTTEGIEINYFELDSLTQEQYTEIMGMFADFEKGIPTPTTYILEGKTVVAKQPGYTDKVGFTTFFKTNGMIE